MERTRIRKKSRFSQSHSRVQVIEMLSYSELIVANNVKVINSIILFELNWKFIYSQQVFLDL